MTSENQELACALRKACARLEPSTVLEMAQHFSESPHVLKVMFSELYFDDSKHLLATLSRSPQPSDQLALALIEGYVMHSFNAIPHTNPPTTIIVDLFELLDGLYYTRPAILPQVSDTGLVQVVKKAIEKFDM